MDWSGCALGAALMVAGFGGAALSMYCNANTPIRLGPVPVLGGIVAAIVGFGIVLRSI